MPPSDPMLITRPAATPQMRQRGLRQQERSAHIHRKHRIPLFDQERIQRSRFKGAGVVHQQIDPTQKVRRIANGKLHLVRRGHVAAHDARTNSQRGTVPQGRVCGIIDHARCHDEVGAFGCKRQRKRPAQPAHAACYQRPLALQAALHYGFEGDPAAVPSTVGPSGALLFVGCFAGLLGGGGTLWSTGTVLSPLGCGIHRQAGQLQYRIAGIQWLGCNRLHRAVRRLLHTRAALRGLAIVVLVGGNLRLRPLQCGP